MAVLGTAVGEAQDNRYRRVQVPLHGRVTYSTAVQHVYRRSTCMCRSGRQRALFECRAAYPAA